MVFIVLIRKICYVWYNNCNIWFNILTNYIIGWYNGVCLCIDGYFNNCIFNNVLPTLYSMMIYQIIWWECDTEGIILYNNL
jgi:hypothetical protein